MFGSIHDSLRRLLYTEARLPEDQLDIRFGTPTGEWVSALTRPTVNFFMHDVQENLSLRRMDQLTMYEDGRVSQHLAPRRVNLRYLITVFFKGPQGDERSDEWEVLWRVLAALLKHAEWPDELLPPQVRQLGVGIRGDAAQPDGPRTGEIFSGLGLTLRPHLTYTLTVPLDLNIDRVARLVLERDTTVYSLGEAEPAVQSARSTWRVQDAAGSALPGLLVTASGGQAGYTNHLGEVILDLPLEDAQTLTVRATDGTLHRLKPDDANRLVLPNTELPSAALPSTGLSSTD